MGEPGFDIENFLITYVGLETGEECPECGSMLLANRNGDEWCSGLDCCWANSQEMIDLCEHLLPTVMDGLDVQE